MTVSEIFDEYIQAKKRIPVLVSELQHLEDSPIIKVTKYGEEKLGNGGTLDDTYHKLIERKQELEALIWFFKGKVVKVETVLRVLKDSNEEYYKLLKLRHERKKTLTYIEATEFINRRTLIRKLTLAEEEFKRLHVT